LPVRWLVSRWPFAGNDLGTLCPVHPTNIRLREPPALKILGFPGWNIRSYVCDMNSSGVLPARRILYVANEDFAFLLNRLPMARAAREAGFEVHVATRVDKNAKAIEAEGFILHRIPFRRGDMSPFTAIPTILALRRIQNKIKPQIAHHAGLQCCVYGSIAALGKPNPVVNAITGLGYIFTSVTWRTRLLKRSMVWLLPWLFNRPQSLVLVQNPDDRAVLETLGVHREQMVLIPGSGVDTDLLQSLPEPEGSMTIGFAGRLLADKGIRALVAAFGILRGQGHDINLIIAGNPDPANPASVLLEEAQEWSRQPGITWLGHIDNIVPLWKRCHIAVLPSHREGLPMSLLEAAACGRPLIAADAPGCREIAIDGQTGLLVPIEDPPRLAEAILRLVKSPELRARYGAAARELVVDKLSAKIIGKAVVALYDRLAFERTSEIVRPPALRSAAETSPRAGKIILVSQHYAPFPSTTSGYMTELANDLALKSRLLVITSSPQFQPVRHSELGRPEVVEIKSWWPGKSALVSRSLAAIFFSIQVFISVLKHARKEDVVLSVTTPFTAPYAATLAARLCRAASSVIIYDLYPDTLTMAGLLRPSSALNRFLRWTNKIMFRWLDSIVVIGRDMAAKLLEYPQVSAQKISFIPNWTTLPVRYRNIMADNQFRLQCHGKFIVAISGNAGFTHDPKSVFEAALLMQANTGIHFLLSGEGVGWTKLKELQANNSLSNITMIERVPEENLEEFLSAADVWIIPYRKNNTGVSVPSRLYNLLAVGRPIIICSEPDAEAALLVREHDLGWVVQPENPQAIVEAILIAASSSGHRLEKGHRAAALAPQYTPQIALTCYRELLGGLLAKQTAKITTN
jgi:glycosyltransferase involved in cell wall biosynthesis